MEYITQRLSCCRRRSRQKRGTALARDYEACPISGNTEGICPVTQIQVQGLAVAKKEEGNDLFRTGNYQGAVEKYTEACKLTPTNGVLFLNRSKAYAKIGDTKKALEDAKRAVNLDDSNVKAHWTLASTLKQMNKTKDGLRHITKAWKILDKDDPENYVLLQLENDLEGKPPLPDLKTLVRAHARTKEKEKNLFLSAISGNEERSTVEEPVKLPTHLAKERETLEEKKRSAVEECVLARRELREKAKAMILKGQVDGSKKISKEERKKRVAENRIKLGLDKEDEELPTGDGGVNENEPLAVNEDSGALLEEALAESHTVKGVQEESTCDSGENSSEVSSKGDPPFPKKLPQNTAAERAGTAAALATASAKSTLTAPSIESGQNHPDQNADEATSKMMGKLLEEMQKMEQNEKNGESGEREAEGAGNGKQEGGLKFRSTDGVKPAYKSYDKGLEDDLTIKTGHKHMARPKDVILPPHYGDPIGKIGVKELGNYNCYNPRMMLSVFGSIFEVSDRPDKYGPKGPYWELTGKDITYGLSIGNDRPQCANQFYDLYKAEDPTKEMMGMMGWLYHFEKEYGEPVGRLDKYDDESYFLPTPPSIDPDDKGECSIQ